MTKKKSDTRNKEKVLQLINERLAVQITGTYYGRYKRSDGQTEEISLGSTYEEVLDKVEDLNSHQVTLIRYNDEESIDQALEQEVSSVESTKDLWADLISEVSDLSVDPNAGDLAVYIGGVDVQRTTDRSLPNDHPVKTCPLVFYWHDKKKNVENGSTITNSGWTVLNKELARKLEISTNRDDTPNQNYFTSKSLVLCVARKDQYKRKKAKQALKFKLASVYEMERRKAEAEDAARKSKVSIDAARSIYENDFKTTLYNQAQVDHVNSGGKKLASDFMKELEDASLEDIEKLGQNIDSALSKGDFQTTMGGRTPLSESDI